MPRLGGTLVCDECQKPIDPLGPGIVGHDSRRYAPFLEDLRSDPAYLAHTECFASTYGFGEFQTLETRNDSRMRGLRPR